MGEKEEKNQELGKKAEEAGGEKAAAGDGTKEDAVGTVVLKLHLHCQGCAKKVTRLVSQFDGVVTVKADCYAKKLIVMGNVDPFLLLEWVEQKTKKKVELISYPPQRTSNGDKKAEEKPDKKAEDKKGDENQKVPKVAVDSTVVMKIKLHCDDCAHKIKRIILKNIDRVNTVTTDLQNDLVTMTGTMNVKEVVSYLKEKLKRGVDIVLPKKDEEEKNEEKEGGPTDKKQKEISDGGGQDKKNEKQGSVEGSEKKEDRSKLDIRKSGDEGTKVEVSKIEHHSYSPQTYYAMPAYHQSYPDQGGYGAPIHHYNYHQEYAIPYGQGPSPPSPTYVDTVDQVLSDENPGGCFVM